MIKIIKKNIKIITLVLVVCLCLYLANDYNNKNKENYENDCQYAKFIFFHIVGCSHCEKLKEIWNPEGKSKEFQKIIKNDNELNKKVKLKAYNEEHKVHKENLDMIKENGGYPTLLLIKCDNEKILYNGNRDSNSMKNWLTQKLI